MWFEWRPFDNPQAEACATGPRRTRIGMACGKTGWGLSIGLWLAPRATFRSGLRWRPKLLQWEFLVGIGPDNQVGNVSFETRPPMWHAAGDDDHIALGEST